MALEHFERQKMEMYSFLHVKYSLC